MYRNTCIKALTAVAFFGFILWMFILSYRFETQEYPNKSPVDDHPLCPEIPAPNVTVKPYPYKALRLKTPISEPDRIVVAPKSTCTTPPRGPRLLVTYCYFHNAAKPIQLENIKFFIHHAVERFRVMDEGTVDYVFIVNGMEHPGVEFPEACNVWVVKRKNSMDLCAYAAVMNEPVVDLRQYTFYMFMNSGIVGPFLPNYWTETWYIPFIKQFYKHPNIKIVGPYVNCEISPHVQTPMFIVDGVGLEIISELWKCVDKVPTVYEIEVPQSTLLITRGYKIASLLYIYEDTEIKEGCNTRANAYWYGIQDPDAVQPYLYYPSVFELVFVKFIDPTPVDERAIYLSYMKQAEQKRLNCKCWVKGACEVLELC